MPLYEYKCKECNKTFEVVKKMSDFSRVEICDCGFEAEKMINFRGTLMNTKVEEAEYNIGLGCWTKSKRHRKEIAKRRGLVEIGNDEKPDDTYKRFETQREQKSQKKWDKLTEELISGV